MAEKVTLTTNVPLELTVRFCDIVVGADGVEFRFKARRERDGADVVLYLAHDPCLDALVAGKLISDLPEYSLDPLPAKAIEVRLAEKRLTFLAEQVNGARRRKLLIIGRPEEDQQPAAAPDASPATAGSGDFVYNREPARVIKPVRCGEAYLDCMRFVAANVVPEFQKLYGRAPSDDAIDRHEHDRLHPALQGDPMTAPLAVLDGSIHHNTVVPGTEIEIALPADAKKLAIKYLMHARIHPDPQNPRRYAADEIDEMRASIAAEGLQQPITVRAIPEGMEGECAECGRPWSELAGREHMIIWGERRWRGSLGILNFVPAIVRTDHEDAARRLVAQLVENFQRKDLSPLEEAYGYRDAMAADPALTQQELSRLTGKSRSSITDRLALLRNVAWLPLLESGEITVSQMIEVSRFADRSAADHATAIRVARDVAGAEGEIADLEIARFRTLVTTVLYVDPNAVHESQETPSEGEASPDAATAATNEGQSASPPETLPAADTRASKPDDGSLPTDRWGGVDHVDESSTDDEDSEPAHHEAPAASGPSGTAPADLGNPSDHAEAPARSLGRDETAAELPAPTAVSKTAATVERERPAVRVQHGDARGLFVALAPVVAGRGLNIMMGPSASAGSYRVTIMSTAKGAAPLVVDGTADELDAELPAAVEAWRTNGAPAAKGARVAATPSAPAKPAASAPARKSKPMSAPKKAAPAKPVAKKAVPKKAAVKALAKKPAKPRGPAPLYLDAALAAVLSSHTGAIKAPAAERAVRVYAKAHGLIGTGQMKHLISCDDALRTVFGAPIVKLQQLAKLLKPHLIAEAPSAKVEQIDLVDELAGSELDATAADDVDDIDHDEEED